MHVCMYGHTYSKSTDQSGMVANPARGQLNRENLYLSSAIAPENLISRETGSAVPSRVSLLISIHRLNLVLTYMGFLPNSVMPSIYFIKPPYAIGPVPSLSSHAIEYRWCSLPRVHRPQGSSERVLPWRVTMDQLICASLSHIQYWYEVGMLKVPASAVR